MERLEDIQKTLEQIYLKNSLFLQKYHCEVYEKLKVFENTYKENYYIDIKDNHFELVDIDGETTYNCDPFYDAQYRAKNIDKHISGISMLDHKKREIESDENFEFSRFINQYIELFKNKKIDTNIKYKKFIFIGTLLGVHLNDIAKVVQSNSYLIIEDNLEVFRLSLFLTDYEQLAQNSKLFFAINLKDDDLKEQIREFFNYKYEDNYFLKYEIASEKHLKIFDKVSKIVSTLNPSIYPYSEILRSFVNGLNNFKISSNGLLNLSVKHKILSDYKVLFLASGPSLYKNIDFIKKNKKKFLIVSAASSLKRLEIEDIVPDIILSIDSNQNVLEDIAVDEKYYNNSILLASINTNKEVFKKFNNENIYLVQDSLELFNNSGVFTGITVGDVGVKILLRLGVEELYICGIDAALDQENGLTHDTTHISSKKIDLKESSIIENEKLDFSKQVIKVKGNFKNEVFTTVYYKNIIDSFETISQSLNKDIIIYNLSFGAFLKGTKAKKTIDIKLNGVINKTDLQNILKEKLKYISRDTLYKDELNHLKLEEKIAKDFKNISKLGDTNLTFISKIIEEYYKLTSPYYNFILKNYKELDKKVLDNIQKTQIDIILNEFKKTLKPLL
ncbi:MAG: 6-hydroxymethylpterin diphosphokinase MptE-like protein [Campylobacterota bacterium]|nr:6-hydroxymethylpterin diphosphokinase MptE-like protein [Campylobacterota bacterium]